MSLGLRSFGLLAFLGLQPLLAAAGVPVIVTQPPHQTVVAGSDALFRAEIDGSRPLAYQWERGSDTIPAATNETLTVRGVGDADAGDYRVIAWNSLGTVASRPARLTVLPVPPAPGSLDRTYAGPEIYPTCLAMQADGRLLVGIEYAAYASDASRTLRRFLSDGRVDPGFDLGRGIDGGVRAVQVLEDGRILIGGYFQAVNGLNRAKVAILHADGAADGGFAVRQGPEGDGAWVSCVLAQPDGKVLIGGRFERVAGQTRRGVARFNPDGSLDMTFSPPATLMGPNDEVLAMVMDPEGRVVIGGRFSAAGSLARLRMDGSVDPTFQVTVGSASSHLTVNAIARQPDGRIVIAGGFNRVNGVGRTNLARLEPDGRVDLTFDAGGLPGSYQHLVLQPDGKLIVSGWLFRVGGAYESAIVRLMPDGSVDASFTAPSLGAANGLALQPDGNVVVCVISTVVGMEIRGLGRLWGGVGPGLGVPAQDRNVVVGAPVRFEVAPFGTQPLIVEWRRDGEAVRAPTTNGVLGLRSATEADAGDYEVVLTNPFGCTTNRVGRLTVLGAAVAPSIVEQPGDLLVVAGGEARFRVAVQGTEPMTCQWLQQGRALAGATNLELRLPAVKAADAGAFQVVVSNPAGTARSRMAQLTVPEPPRVSVRPYPTWVPAGATVTLEVEAAGTPPFEYHWRREPSMTTTSPTGPRLETGPFSSAQAGVYVVEVANAFGVAFSQPMTLTLARAGAVDQSFRPGTLDGGVEELEVLPGGGIVIGGGFVRVAGSPADRVARLQENGELDHLFDVRCQVASCCDTCNARLLLVQPDGRVIMSGSRCRLARFQADGNLDEGFVVSTKLQDLEGIGSCALQADGKLLISHRNVLMRLNPDGTEDRTFAAWISTDGEALAWALEPEGRILVGGSFGTANGESCSGLVRLEVDGSVDASFEVWLGGDARVEHLIREPDGRIILAGSFTTVNGVMRYGLARVHADGNLDATFDPGFPSLIHITAMARQADGRLLVATRGHGTDQPPALRNGLARLETNGTVDVTFDVGSGPNDVVNRIALDGAGRILIGGYFTSVDGVACPGLARLNGAGLPTVSRVPPPRPGDQEWPAVASDGQNFLVVWCDWRREGTTERDIMGARVTAEGEVLDPVGIPICTAAGRQEAPDVAFDGTQFLVVWQDDRRSGSMSPDIFGARVSRSGEVLDPDGFPVSQASGMQSTPVLAFNGSHYLVVWTDWRHYEQTISDIYGARVSPSGVVLDPDGLRIHQAPLWQTWPAVAAAGGAFAVVWNDMNDIRVKVLGMDGGGLEGPGRVLAIIGNEARPSVAGDASGFLVAWQDIHLKSDGSGYLTNFVKCLPLATNGIPGLPQAITVFATNEPVSKTAVTAVPGGWWTSWGVGDGYSSDAQIYGARLMSGVPGTAVPVCTVPKEQTLADVAAAGPWVLAVWQDARNALPGPIPSSPWDIYGARISASDRVPEPGGFLISTAQRAIPIASWASPADVVYGTPLGAVQLNATADVEGVFSYDPPAGAVLDAGVARPLWATFTPRDTNRYIPVQVWVPLNVLPAPLVIRAEDKFKQPGMPLPALTAAYEGLVPQDTPAVLDWPVILTTSARVDSPVGLYPILARGARDANYSIRLQDGTLTIGFPPEPATRELPGFYRPGVAVTVRLRVVPPDGSAAHALEDVPPVGWTVISVSDGGVFDGATHEVKFGPFFDTEERVLTYAIVPPLTENRTVGFTGVFSADGTHRSIAGDHELVLAMAHPAEAEPGDWLMQVDEVTAYGGAWRQGKPWRIGPNPIPIDYVTRAAGLWREGERYRYAPEAGTPPLCWVPDSVSGLNSGPKELHPGMGTAQSDLPTFLTPRARYRVTIEAKPGNGVAAYAVEDLPPAGWQVVAVLDAGVVDASHGTVRWGPFPDHVARTLRYEVSAPAQPVPSATFRGVASFDGRSVPLNGQRTLAVGSRLSVLKSTSDLTWSLVLEGDPEGRYLIESSTDLVRWSAFAECQGGERDLELPQPSSGCRFFRARPVPGTP